MNDTVKRLIAGQEKVLVGELHCYSCNGVTDIRFGGVESGYKPVDKCSKCGEGRWEKLHWVNQIRDWENRGCLFMVDEVAL